MENRIGFGSRLGAYLIDIILVWVLAFVMCMMFPNFLLDTASEQLNQAIATNPLLAESFNAQMEQLMLSLIRFVLMIVFARLILFLPEIFFAASPGKMMLKLRIAKTDGTEALRLALLGRYAIKHCAKIFTILAYIGLASLFNTLSSLCGFIVFVGCFFAAGDAHQALHDKICNTAVFKQSAVTDNAN